MLENLSYDAVGSDANWSVALWIVEPAIVQVQRAYLDEFLKAPPPDGAMNPGRTLRCLYMSFLC